MKTAVVTSARIISEDDAFYIDKGVNTTIIRYKKYFGDITVFGMDGSDKGKHSNTASRLDVEAVILGSRNDLLLGKEMKLLERELPKYELIILRVPSITCDRAAKIAREHGIPYYVEVIGDAFDSLWYHSLKAKPFAITSYFRTKKTVYNANYALYVTKEFLQRRYPSSGITLGCSDVDISEMDNNIEAKRIEKINNNNLILKIGTVAAIDVPYKGQEYVIRALGELKKHGNLHFEYYLVGNGNRKRLEEIARICNVTEYVHFLGGIPHEKIFEWLDTMDLYIQPSKTEGLPRALVEAMSRGLPAIGCMTGGIPELISEKYLFHKGDYKTIAHILESINEDDLARMSQENYAKASLYQKDKLNQERDDFLKRISIQIERTKK